MTTRTREEILELWLQTLEQHPERQYKGALGVKLETGKEKFCCLGQLCDIYYGSTHKKIDEKGFIVYAGRDIFLPLEVTYFMHFNSETGETIDDSPSKDGTTCKSLAEMNDEGFTWPEIAAYIRANPKNIFVD